MSADYSTPIHPIHFAPCLHRRVVVDTCGTRDFSEGEVCDDIQERLLCLECMRTLSESEVRARWTEGWVAPPTAPQSSSCLRPCGLSIPQSLFREAT